MQLMAADAAPELGQGCPAVLPAAAPAVDLCSASPGTSDLSLPTSSYEHSWPLVDITTIDLLPTHHCRARTWLPCLCHLRSHQPSYSRAHSCKIEAPACVSGVRTDRQKGGMQWDASGCGSGGGRRQDTAGTWQLRQG